MFDIGWSELLLIGIVALIVVGPEDLPRMFRALGRITARARAMAREFSRAMEDAARESGLDEAGKTLRDVKSVTSKKALGLDALDRAASSFEKWDPKKPMQRKGLRPDPEQPDPDKPVAPGPDMAEAASDASGEGGDDIADSKAAQDKPAAPADTGPVTPPVAESHGRRQLHAIRRADHGGADDTP